ncbi:MAG: hypothetical protein L3J47_11475, partial [Sulfurovum sp.]|nr:hypothetical protein [Sulfurovum sp.]
FDLKLFAYAYEGKSLLFANEMKKNMQRMSADDFLYWLESIRFLPLYDPQTLQVDSKKNIENAMSKLYMYDYVVPNDQIDVLHQHLGGFQCTQNIKGQDMPFSIQKVQNSDLVQKFIGKDMQLYSEAKRLWRICQEEEYVSLRTLGEEKQYIDPGGYTGMIDLFTPTAVAGWIVHEEIKGSIEVGIYRNGALLEKVQTEIMRPGIKERFSHPTGLCGFRVDFASPVFKLQDTLEVKTVHGEYVLEYAPNVKQIYEWFSLN